MWIVANSAVQWIWREARKNKQKRTISLLLYFYMFLKCSLLPVAHSVLVGNIWMIISGQVQPFLRLQTAFIHSYRKSGLKLFHYELDYPSKSIHALKSPDKNKCKCWTCSVISRIQLKIMAYKHTHVHNPTSGEGKLTLCIHSTAQLRLSANRHSSLTTLLLKNVTQTRDISDSATLSPQLQLITHTSSLCIPFTYLNKCSGGGRLVRDAGEHAAVSVHGVMCGGVMPRCDW